MVGYIKREEFEVKSYKIDFSGPFSLHGMEPLLWNSSFAHQPGIYLWTIELQGAFFIEYIGETGKSFDKRTKEHLVQTFGGNYMILDMEAVKKIGEPFYIWKGQGREEDRNFMDLYVDLAPKILEYISSLRLFVAPLVIEKRDQQLIEGCLAKHLYHQEKNINKFFQKGIRYVFNRKLDEDPFHVRLEAAQPILGLPSELLI
jgi:hypothetical protein